MKKITTLVLLSFLSALPSRAAVLFQDALNYPNGCIETDGLWYAYAPAVPKLDAFISNDLLILDQNHSDAVGAPSSNFTNTPGNTIVFASFTINVSTLPSASGGYFAQFSDNTNDYAGRVFIATKGTTVPGTYRLGIGNVATSVSATGVNMFPLDLATDITYQVVFSYDTNLSDSYPNATLWVNPVTINDSNVFATDSPTNPTQVSILISQVDFSQYANQGVAAIGKVVVGTSFGDVQTNIPQIPVIGIGPHSMNLYQNDNLTLYVAASGLGQLSYQWLSNNVPLSDDGVTVIGSQTNVLNLINLQNTANYSVAVANPAGSVTSAVAVVSINTTPTPPFFIQQPYGATNSVGSTITLSALANGTGPLTYQWYFAPSNTSTFSPVSGQTSPTFTSSANFAESGSYYVQATGGAGSPQNSAAVSVLVIPPPQVTIGYLHSFLVPNAPSGATNINGTTLYNVQGMVTTFGTIISKPYCEYYIQDGTGGALVFVNGLGSTNVPAAGTMVSVTCVPQEVYGQLELVPNVNNTSNTVATVGYGNPLPAPAPLNIALIATNTMGAYGLALQGSLVSLTNVYLYSSASGAAVTGNFPNNSAKALYAFAKPYSAGQPYVEVYVYTYTNANNLMNTNYFGKPIPGFAYEVTGPLEIYSTNQPELYPTRYQDIVTAQPAPFTAGLTVSNGTSQLTWPAATGSTYTVYTATNILGPWTRTCGLCYYPSIGIYTVTNPPAAQFYKVSTP
jgi:hypothetical protein